MKDGETEMSKLFIIGNGFDLAHELPTQYEDFHNYLHENYPDANEDEAIVPTSVIGHHGDVEYDDNEVVGYIMNLISRTEGVYWSDLEKTLGKLDFDNDFDDLPEVYDRDGDRNLWHESYNNEDLATNLAGCVPRISDLFEEWVDTVNISHATPRPQTRALIDSANDYFLNFNYTRTLEELYGVQNVCHIHGVQGSNEKLLFGHGEGRLYDEDNFSAYIGCEDGLEEIRHALRKDTDYALRKHLKFFKKINNGFTEMYSYGFCFSDVDQIYLRKIFERINTENVVFYLHKYDKGKHKQQREIIQKCGFNGGFSLFDA